MQILRKRSGYWYLDKYKILNSHNLISLDDAILDDEDSPIFDSELDRHLVLSDYNEMVCELRNMYAAKLRTYEEFQIDKGIIWINSDAQIRHFDLYKLEHDQCFLGSWNLSFKEKIYSSINLLCQRILIVREDWISQAQRSLINDKYMLKEWL